MTITSQQGRLIPGWRQLWSELDEHVKSSQDHQVHVFIVDDLVTISMCVMSLIIYFFMLSMLFFLRLMMLFFLRFWCCFFFVWWSLNNDISWWHHDNIMSSSAPGGFITTIYLYDRWWFNPSTESSCSTKDHEYFYFYF